MRNREARWAELDELAEEWYHLPPGNEAVRQRKEEQLFAGALELLPPRLADALGRFWLKDWRRFDPKKGTFSGYVYRRLNFRREDIRREDLDLKRQELADPETGKVKKRHVRRNTSLNTPIGTQKEGEGAVLADALPDPVKVHDRVAAGVLLLALALKLQARLSTSTAGPRRYFPLFFTDGVTCLIRDEGTFELNAREEREIFASMRLPFLDFFTQRECRTLAALAQTPVKPYGALVEKRPMEELDLPLPADVFTAYLKKVEHYSASASALSQQRKAYKKFGKSLELG